VTDFQVLRTKLGQRFGVLAESSTSQMTVIARSVDVAIGDLFILPCERGPADRFYIFRTTEYANILNRTLEMSDVARNKLTMPDSYFSEDLSDEQLIELKGMVLGYSEFDARSGLWAFNRPRRLPQHLSDVFHVNPACSEIGFVIKELMQSQLGDGGLFIGNLLAGEDALQSVPVHLPAHALSHHIGIFGRTGCGKSNLMMVLLRSIMKHNLTDSERPPISIFAIDPHDEFRGWHAATDGADGIRGIVEGYSVKDRRRLIEPFYYLTAHDVGETPLEHRVFLSRADITPSDLISIMEFSEQQIAFSNSYYADQGETWIGNLLSGNAGSTGSNEESGAEYLPGTIAAVQRRVGFLSQGNTRLITRFNPTSGFEYQSSLADIICALERGRVLIVDTTLMSELEQFLLNTVIARVLFALRRALRAAETPEQLVEEITSGLGSDDNQGQIGMRSFASTMVNCLRTGELPYLKEGKIVPSDQLPIVNIVIEEAPSILNPQRMRFGSVFRDISRQGRKFGIGLTVISQQVSEIDKGVLTQINTELTLALGNADERREAIRNASSDLAGFAQELAVLARGQCLVSTSFRDVALPIQAPNYDQLTSN
jgi:uncharacterized protein